MRRLLLFLLPQLLCPLIVIQTIPTNIRCVIWAIWGLLMFVALGDVRYDKTLKKLGIIPKE